MPTWALVLIGVAFLGVAIFAGVILFQVVEDLVAKGPLAVATAEPVIQPDGTSVVPGDPENPGETVPVVDPGDPANPLPGGVRPNSRVTVLLLGIDRPCVFEEEPWYRSDTMILLTIDPLSLTAGILSIPRDLWVPIPGFGNERINTAYRSGEISEYPGGGPALAVETIELNLGIHVNHYVTINYDGFIQAIDHLGGIEMDVPETINDPDYPDLCYGIDPFYLPAGHHFMDGETALKYARTRATYGADFDRASRQQELMMAVLDQAMRQNVTLLARAPELWNTFQGNVTTDMTYQQAIGLALLANDLPRENIKHAVIDYNYVSNHTLMNGAQVLVPIRENIRQLRDEFFSTPVVVVPTDDLAAQARAEAAGVLVLNGTWTQGLAGSTADYLRSLGLVVAGVDDASNKDQTETQIIDYGGKTATVNYLADVFGVPAGNIYGGTEPDGDYDIALILGTEWQVPAD